MLSQQNNNQKLEVRYIEATADSAGARVYLVQQDPNSEINPSEGLQHEINLQSIISTRFKNMPPSSIFYEDKNKDRYK